MANVAFINMTGQQARVISEPVHLLAMHNISRRKHKSLLVTAGQPDAGKLEKQLRNYRPHVVGLSFVGHDQSAIDAAHDIIGSIGNQDQPLFLLGGTDIKLYREQYLREFARYGRGADVPPVVFVTGPGEEFVSRLAEADFQLGQVLASLAPHQVDYSQPGVVQVSGLPRWALERLETDRDYPLKLYNNRAWVKWVINCWANCPFCPNEPAAGEVISPEVAIEEYQRLVAAGSIKVMSAAPNFNVRPEASAELIRLLPLQESTPLHLTTRVDSQSASIRSQPESWRRFRSFRNKIDLGPEGTVVARLGPGRLGKYETLAAAREQAGKIEEIFNFFEGSSTIITLFMILFDWQMTLDELTEEVNNLKHYLTTYSNVVLTRQGIGTVLFRSPGSFYGRTMAEEDFFRFEREPRALLLYALVRLEENDLQAEDSIRPLAEVKKEQLKLLDYLERCLRIVRNLPADCFNIEPIVDVVRQGGQAGHILEAFYQQMPFAEREVLAQSFDDELRADRPA